MAFNADTYRLNKHRREAREQLARARDIKARVVAGTAYDWEAAGIVSAVGMARFHGHMALSYLRLKQIGRA